MATVHSRTIQSVYGTRDFIFLCVDPSETSPKTTELQAYAAIDDEIDDNYTGPQYEVYTGGMCLPDLNVVFEADAPLITWYWYWLVVNMPFLRIVVKTR